MKGLLLVALFIFSPSIVSAEPICRRVHRIPFPLSESERKVISPNDSLFGHLIGQPKAHVLKCQGEPAKTEPDAWTYHERLGPGAHSYRHHWVVKFKQDKVVEVEVRREAVGCILIPPAREWRSRL